jgi:putative inorganic carbon (HCO3(-)) transporter
VSTLRSRTLWIVWVFAAAGVAWFASAFKNQSTGTLTDRHVILAVAAAVVVLMALNADPAWLISFGIAAGVFNGNWDQIGFGSVLVPDRLLIGAGLAALLLRISPQAKDRPQIRSRPEYWLLAAAAVYVAISAIMAGTIGTNSGFFRLVDRFGLLPFLVFAIAPVAFRTAHQRRILLGTLVLTGAYVGIVTWADAFKVDALVKPDYIKDPTIGITQGRGRGPFAAADANGLALLATAVAALIGFREWRAPWAKLICAAVAVLGIGGTFLTLTRSVWVGTAAAGIVTMLSFRQLRPYAIPAAAAVAAGVLFSLAVVPGLSQRATDRQHDDRPVWDRKNSNSAALRMLGDKPLLGFGWNQYQAKNTDYFVEDRDFPLTGQDVPLHNTYLSNAVELGVLGAAIWLAALVAAIGGTILRRGPPELLPWRLGLAAVAIQWLVIGALAPFPYSFPNLLLWTWAGVASGPLRPGWQPATARMRTFAPATR